MNILLKRILNRIAAMADDVTAPGDYIMPARDGFAQDRANLRGDVATVGADMTRAMASADVRARTGCSAV